MLKTINGKSSFNLEMELIVKGVYTLSPAKEDTYSSVFHRVHCLKLKESSSDLQKLKEKLSKASII